MSNAEYQHITVLLNEAVDALAVREDGIYVDGTFGRGGHSRLILSRLGSQGRLIVFDKDPQAIEAAQKLAEQDGRVTVVHDGFSSFQTTLDKLGIEEIDGALFDLGISSPQIDDGARGFSFRFDAPLDMRMDPTRGMSAAEWIATASEQDLHEVIKNYGEERFSRQIARAIVAQRTESPIDTTRKLAQLVAQNVRTRERGQDPATRTFQAVRIFINRELEEVEAVLPQVMGRLKQGIHCSFSRDTIIVIENLFDYRQHWKSVKIAEIPAIFIDFFDFGIIFAKNNFIKQFYRLIL